MARATHPQVLEERSPRGPAGREAAPRVAGCTDRAGRGCIGRLVSHRHDSRRDTGSWPPRASPTRETTQCRQPGRFAHTRPRAAGAVPRAPGAESREARRETARRCAPDLSRPVAGRFLHPPAPVQKSCDGGSKRAFRQQARSGSNESSDRMYQCGLQRVVHRKRGQDAWQPPGEHRFTAARRSPANNKL